MLVRRRTSPIQNGVKKALEFTGEVKRCLNLGSYNYLGFAAADEYCTARVRNFHTSWGRRTIPW